MAKIKAFMDKHVERFISRKFLAWGNSNWLMYAWYVN